MLINGLLGQITMLEASSSASRTPGAGRAHSTPSNGRLCASFDQVFLEMKAPLIGFNHRRYRLDKLRRGA